MPTLSEMSGKTFGNTVDDKEYLHWKKFSDNEIFEFLQYAELCPIVGVYDIQPFPDGTYICMNHMRAVV